jgi:Asparaginase
MNLLARLYRWQHAKARYFINNYHNISSRASGLGAVFTADGTHEMEASIMDGSNLKVIAHSHVKGNP